MPTDRPAERLAQFESVVDRQIREAAERGEFDELPGAGRPLEGGDTPYDPDWWAKRFVARERLRDRADEVRQTLRKELPRWRTEPDSDATKTRVAEMNRVIEQLNAVLLPADQIAPIEL